MPQHSEGTLLTCAHEECDCRVRIEAECHCPGVGADSQYICACGAPLVPVDAASP